MLVDLIVIAIAAWRAAHMLVEESGPFRVFAALRRLAGASDDVYEAVKPGSFAQLFSCVACMTVWTGALCWAFWQAEALRPVVVILAASGAALMLASYTGTLR